MVNGLALMSAHDVSTAAWIVKLPAHASTEAFARVLSEALSERFGRDIRVAVQLEDAPAKSEPAEEQPTRRPWAADAQRAGG